MITWGPSAKITLCRTLVSTSMVSSSRFHNRRDVWHLPAAAAATWRRTSFKCEVSQASQLATPQQDRHYLLDSLAPLKDV